MRRIWITGLLLATCTAARGEFDIAAYCKQLAEVGGAHSYTLERSCRQQEEGARKRVAKMEDSTPGSVLAYCDNLASSTGPGSYMLMESCIKMEMQAKKQLRY